MTTALVATFSGLLIANPPAAPQVSSFAPAEDILSQVDYYTDRLATAVADKDGYTKSKQKRVAKDGNTLSVLLLALGMHDQDHRLKASAAVLLPLAQRLAESSGDYDTAKPAYDALAEVLQNGASGGPTLTWQKVASLGQLMKQVPTINNRLRRSLRESRFEKDTAKSAGYAAALAVIAQAAMADTHEVKNPADTDKWYQYCAEMRDAAGAINAAIRKKDFEAATIAGKQLKGLCKQCHDVFREEEEK